MSNRWTRVPDHPAPALPWLGRIVLPLADLFMILLLSRPSTGSLRSTWVTPATLILCVATAIVGVLFDTITLPGKTLGHGPVALISEVVIAVLVGGCLSVAAVGLMQRR